MNLISYFIYLFIIWFFIILYIHLLSLSFLLTFFIKYSQKNTKIDNLGNKNSLIYTEEGAHLIDDLDEEEVIIEDPKNTEKNKKIPKILKKNQSKENTQKAKKK